jgi:mono/diheme cytochrome c family protein
MLRPSRLIPFTLLLPAVVWLAVPSGPARGAITTGTAVLYAAGQAAPVASHMKEHFDKVAVVHEAVLRGDLDSVREPAKWLAEHPSDQGLPPKSATQISAMQTAAKRAAEATDLKAAAAAAATMASTCGTCHRTNEVTPKMPEPKAPSGTGTAAHMLAHQQAVDYMYQGLIVPSDELWNKGADLLRSAPLAKEQLPADPKLTEEIKAFETKVHELAGRARKASDPKSRVTTYAELIGDCAQCHSLHGRAWGPGVPK